ncbi:glycosyltransferase family 39 protein [Methanobacterium alcaliphilum]|uniref:glycosyltransferase family 39 protein n=1 Tax=Methanobacterium alcaliphilum TaxID=392018 RepID=UPI002009EFED|nr:glycosyltransferase family 39 protein [Methanobacterium alcaliphilum]MCK9151926.1 glycosyltransferase family 39 protein [Methanobacterium alcaliphilum]
MSEGVSNLIQKCENWFILLPAIIVFCLVLIPTLKYQWPLSWDIFYHIHLSELYFQNGLTYWDMLTYAPYGRPIYYAPLFHFTLLNISKIFNISLFDAARYLQPVLTSLIVLSFSLAVSRIYNSTAGFLTGIFVMFTPLFYRMVLPIPEAMAMMFLPLIGLFYYLSLENNDFKYALLAGIFWGLTLLTHMLSAGIIILVIIVFTIISKIKNRDTRVKYFILFSVIGLFIAAIWWLPLLIKYGYVFKSPPAEGYLPDRYMDVFGSIPFIFGAIGILHLLQRKEKRDILFISWLFTVLVVSLSFFIGVPVITDRILTFAVFPLMALASIGVGRVNFNRDKKPFYVLIILITILGSYSGYITLQKGQIAVSDSEIDIAQWFKNNGDKTRVAVFDNFLMDPVVVSISKQPVSAGGYAPGMVNAIDINKYLSGNFTSSEIDMDNVGYLILKNNATDPPYGEVVYQNKAYKIFQF